MPIELPTRLKNAWNAFIKNKDPTKSVGYDTESVSYAYRPDRPRTSRGAERSIVNAVYNRIAMDVAAVQIRHVRLDENDRYLETIDSDMNECFATEANIDQTGRSLVQDIVLSMFDEGCVAVIPVDTDSDPDESGNTKIYTMRTAKIISWKPNSVRVRAYNDRTGQYEEIDVLKRNTLIIENPLYAVVNEPNSTMQRLIRKLALLDSVDEQSSAGKLDLIIQLPYTVRSELRKQQAMDRKKMIEEQLANSKYGIAYIDSTEHITQLNRAVENNLMGQIEYLTNMVYSQLGITAEILNGTADEKTMLNYNNRTIEPILSAIVDEAKRKWLTKTARTQKQSIMFFRDPFKLVPISNLADIADKFTRNEILTSNEVRQIVGMKKSEDPNADQLRNKNLNQSMAEMMPGEGEEAMEPEETEEDIEAAARDEMQTDYDDAVAELDDLDVQIKDLEKLLDEDEAKQSDDDGETWSEEEEFIHDYLMHYANPYYDPVKAHEYYMKHRKLKGRSTSGLNEEGRDAAYYVKQKLNAERKEKVDADKATMDSNIESSKSTMSSNIKRITDERADKIAESKHQMESKVNKFRELTNSLKEKHVEIAKDRIKNLQSQISVKGRTEADKARIRAKIETLRKENSEKRAELQSQFKNMQNSLRSEHNARSATVKESAKASTESERNAHKDTSSKLRSAHKETAAKLKEEYDNKYYEALDELKGMDEFKKEDKSKSSGGKTLYKKKNYQ